MQHRGGIPSAWPRRIAEGSPKNRRRMGIKKKAPQWRCSVDGCRFCTPAGNRAVASALPTTLIKGLMNHSVSVFVPPGGIEPSSKV